MKEAAAHIATPVLQRKTGPFFLRSVEEGKEENAFFKVQAKLAVGGKNDPAEREADAIADTVVSKQGIDVQTCAACEQEEQTASKDAVQEKPAAAEKNNPDEKENDAAADVVAGKKEDVVQEKCAESDSDKKVNPKKEDAADINPVQTKLSVGRKDDPYEQQADAAADSIVNRSTRDAASVEPADRNNPIQKKTLSFSPIPITPVQAKCAECEQEALQEKEERQEEPISRKAAFESADDPPEQSVQRMCRECEEGMRIFRTVIGQAAGGGSSKREAVIAMAKTMLGKIKAKQPGAGGQRVGADQLWEIFKLAAPGIWSEEAVKTSGQPLPSWCGIFAVWAHKKAGIDLGNWQMGRGVTAFGTLKQTTTPQPGDIGYIDQPYQHHCIVTKVNGDSIESIDGNSGLFSEVIENTRPLKAYSGFFTAFSGSSTGLQKKETGEIQEKGEANTASDEPVETALHASKGGGSALEEGVKQEMETGFEADFSQVRIHTGSAAVQMSNQLHAQAFTHGSDIYFNESKFDPGSSQGKHLLAHELTHTLQQGASMQKKPEPAIQKQDDENPNYSLLYNFRDELVPFFFKLSDAVIEKITNNTDADALIRQGLNKSMYFDDGTPVYETPAFLKTVKVTALIKSDIEAWPGINAPVMNNLQQLITARVKAVENTFILEKLTVFLRTSATTDPAFIDWNILLPLLKADVMNWQAESAVDASDFDQYEWALDLLADEVKGFDPVAGAVNPDAAEFNRLIYPFIIDNPDIFSEEVMGAHSEKFLALWLDRIAQIKYVPDNFSIDDFAVGDEINNAEKLREKLLQDFISREVPVLMVNYLLDQWTISGQAPDDWLKNLDVDAYKDALLDHLAATFIAKALTDPAYAGALRVAAIEKTKFDTIRLIYLLAAGRETYNKDLENLLGKTSKADLDEEEVYIVEGPSEYFDQATQVASATGKFLGAIQPDRSISEETFTFVNDIIKALNIPEKYVSLFQVGQFAVYIGNFQKTVQNEKSDVKKLLSDRIEVDYESIAKVVKDWVKYADEFIDKQWLPMLKAVAMDMLRANKEEIEWILDNYDQGNERYATDMYTGADELEKLADGLQAEDYEEIEYEGKIATKKDIPYLRDLIQFMRDEANARSSGKLGEEEKSKLQEAIDSYEQVMKDVESDEFDPLDYSHEVYEEARKRLGISEFEDFTTVGDVLNGRIAAAKNPFLAKVIVNWHWKETAERAFYNGLLLVGLGLLTVGSMLVPGVGGLILGVIDISVGIGMGVHGVVDAYEILRMAKLDTHGTIRGVSVEQAEEAVKHAWLGLVFNVVLTVGPIVLSKVLKVRGAGGVELGAETRSWENTLSKETRDALKANPALRKLYAEMDEGVRRLLTLCESPCIPLDYAPKPGEVDRIKSFMQKLKVPDNHPGLREYLHHPSRRENLTKAMDGIEDVKNMGELEARLDRAIAGNVKQAGASASKAGSLWKYTRPDGVVVTEYEIASHGYLTDNRGTTRFFQSHHGIQDAWAVEKGISGYARDDCPAILLRDSKLGTPHQIVTARQAARAGDRVSRTYALERDLLIQDMKAAGVPEGTANNLLGQSDSYFGKLYRNIEAAGDLNELDRIFGIWKP